MNKKNYIIIAKYNSKYGKILYATEIRNGNRDVNLDNCYIQTLYYKGEHDFEVGNEYSLMTVKAENGYIYCFD